MAENNTELRNLQEEESDEDQRDPENGILTLILALSSQSINIK